MSSVEAQVEAKFSQLIEQVEKLQTAQEQLVELIAVQAKTAGLPQLLSLKEAAFQLSISPKGLQRLRSDGRILAVALGTGKVMIPLSEIMRLASPHLRPTPPPAPTPAGSHRPGKSARAEAAKIRALIKRR